MEQTLLLDTNAEYFARWLEQATAHIWMTPFPTENGRITLQGAGINGRYNGVLVITMQAILVYPNAPNTETALPLGNWISFRVVPLSTERIEVQATCAQPVLADYYQQLIGEITKRWPQPKSSQLSHSHDLSNLPLSVPIDSIDSFAGVKFITSDAVKQQFPKLPVGASESEIKHLFHSIVEDPFPKKDWGGEQNDIFTSRIVLQGQRRHTAFFLKGPAVRGKLTIAKCGKNGDQIQRLFQSPAEVFVIQYNGEIDERVVEEAKQKVENLRAKGREAVVTFVDGYDTARLLAAYNSES